jgi:hypothetical protein
MPGAAVLLAQYLVQGIQPLVNRVEGLAEFPAAVGTVLRAGGHTITPLRLL